MYFNGTKCFSLVFCLALSLSLMAKDVNTATESGGLRKPLCFVENKGQLVDQDNNPRNDIQYKLSTPGMSLFVGNGQLHYQFKKVEGTTPADNKVSTYRMDVTLVGADKYAKVIATDMQEYYENYFLTYSGNEGLTVHSWNKITYKDVYPGIDWVLYVKDNKVEYDFVVRPGGNVNDIQLKYSGATALKIKKDGSLSAKTPMGNIEEQTPYAYETATGKAIASNFRLHNHIVSFETGSYNGCITIDPSLSWSTYVGGIGEDVITSSSVAQSGGLNTYVGGYTTSTTLATSGVFEATFGSGTMDAFLGKYSNTGALTFITYFGAPFGAGASKGTSVALDIAANNVYLAGYTTSAATGLTSGGAYQGMNRGGNDGFLLKLNNTGVTRQWCTFYGGTGDDFINGVAVDASNNVYITGQTASATFIATGGAYQTALSGTDDAFLAEFSSTGAIQWSTYYGGTAQDEALGINCDVLGHINITGQTNSTINMASSGAYQTTLSGTNDAFIAQFNNSGTRIWGTYFGGTGTEQGNGVAADAAGNIAVTGNTTSGAGIASAKAFQATYGGVQDAFVAYLLNDGTLTWSSYYGGTALDYGQSVCFDLNNNIVVAGGTFSSSGIATANSFQPAIGGDYDAFIAKINPLGQTLWNSYFGGTFYDYANAVGCDQSGQLSIAGYTTSTGAYGSGGLSTSGAVQPNNAGGIYDAFITKFDVDTFVVIPQPFTDTLVCAGGPFSVPFTVYPTTATFQPGNVFTVEMSDASGSFATPATIGSLVATGPGVPVPCTIPALASGPDYRIRIVASNPAFISPDDYLNINVVSSIPATTASATTPACVGASNTISLFDNASYSISNWSWAGPAGSGFSSTLQNPVITGVSLADAGTYTVTATHNGCPDNTATVTVVVNTTIPPTPSDSFGLACSGQTLSLFAHSDTTATGITYYWSGPAGFTSTLQNPTIPGATTANSGFYALVDTLAGCPSSAVTFSVTVNPDIPVTASITASPGYVPGSNTEIICSGAMVSFTASVVNGGSSPAYQWFAGGTPVVGAISSTWSSPTLVNLEAIYCQVSSSVVCPLPANAPSNVVTMNVIDNSPLVYISASPGIHVAPGTNVTFTSTVYNGGTGPRYQWQINGVNVTGATDSAFVDSAVNQADTVTLIVISNMMCPGVDSMGISNTLIAESNVGVTSISAALDAVGLFPNPNNGSFTIKGIVQNSNSGTVGYGITNLLGQVVCSGNAMVQRNELNKTIQLSNIADGIYLLRLNVEGQDKIFRFSVQH